MNRDRSPMHSRGDVDDDGIRADRDRSRRGDKPSRFGPRSSSPNLGGRKGGAEKRIFVSNIAYEFRWQELKDLFREEIGEVSYVELFTDDNAKPRGCGIVEFESAESVQKAVDKMHRYDLNGRKLVVKEDFGVERDKCGRPMKGERGLDSHMGGGGGGDGGGRDLQDMREMSRRRDESRAKWEPNTTPLNTSQINNPGQGQSGSGANQWGNTYGLSPQFLEGLWISGPLVPKVFVANLDYKVDRKKLKEVFKMAGKVVRAELHLDKDGKSRGFGVIEYDHPVEAVQAISMFHNQMLYDRKLTVRMDRVDNKSDAPVKLPEGLRGIGMGLGTNGNPLQDVSRNLPSLSQTTGLVSSVPATAGNLTAASFNALSNAAALSNVVNSSSMGLGNTGPIGLGGLGNGMLSSGLGGPGDLAGLSNLAAGGGYGGGNLGGGLNVASQLGGLANAAALGGGNAFGGGLVGGTNFLGGNAFGAGGTNSSLAGNAFGNVNRGDFDSMNGGVMGSGYITGSADRDFRTLPSPAVSAFQNNQSRLGSSPAVQSNSSNAGNNGNNAGSRGRDIILVKNLPSTFTWQMLRDKFRDIGEVKYAEMRSKDAGLVRFNNEWDAERAVHMMDRKRIDGRAIEVSLFG